MSAARTMRFSALTIVAAIVLGACNTQPALSDPKEILTKAFEAAEAAKTVHLAATVDGSFRLDLTGQGTGGAMDLTGTTFEGDVDLDNTKARLTFAVPAFLGLSGELIAVDGASYIKTSLTGALYQKQAGSGALPVDPSNPENLFTQLKALLDKPGVDPAKGGDVDCDGRKCYSVAIELTAAELAGLASPSPSATPDPNTNLDLTFLVEKDSVRFHKITAVIAAGPMGTLTLGVTLTDWDKAVSIEAPPDDQVTEGGGFPF